MDVLIYIVIGWLVVGFIFALSFYDDDDDDDYLNFG